MNANFIDESGKEKPFVMGCYGIGVTRTMASIIEQHNDENGIVWPLSVAPYHVNVIPVNIKDEEQIINQIKINGDICNKKHNWVMGGMISLLPCIIWLLNLIIIISFIL